MSPHRETRDPLPRVRVNYVSTDAYIISEMTSAQCLQNQLQHQLQRQVQHLFFTVRPLCPILIVCFASLLIYFCAYLH